MAGGAQPNPYGANSAEYAGQYANASDYGSPSNAYAAPGPGTDAPYNDEFGWGPSPRISVGSTPDAMRVQSFPVRTFRPDDNDAPGVFYRPLDADDKARHAVEEQDANGWDEKKSRYVIGPDPRWNPPSETRVTERMAPTSYSFVRPFDQESKGNGARSLNGIHMSMADHRREFEVLGMRPWSAHRNTYRVDPTPWDADMYDVPPEQSIGTISQARVQAINVPDSANRAFRL